MTSVDRFDADVRRQKAHETDVLLSKHRDYGPKNIALSPGGPVNGLRVRLHDKLARLNHLVDSGAEPEHEALVDTALDVANYGTILALVLRGEWPDVPVDPNDSNVHAYVDEDAPWGRAEPLGSCSSGEQREAFSSGVPLVDALAPEPAIGDVVQGRFSVGVVQRLEPGKVWIHPALALRGESHGRIKVWLHASHVEPYTGPELIEGRRYRIAPWATTTVQESTHRTFEAIAQGLVGELVDTEPDDDGEVGIEVGTSENYPRVFGECAFVNPAGLVGPLPD